MGRKFRRNRFLSHGLGDMSTFAIPPKSNPIQAINPMKLHTKFQKARLNTVLILEI